MKTIKVMSSIISVIAILILSAYAYYGGLKSVSPLIKECGGEILVYKKVSGDYAQSAAVSDQIYKQLLDDYGLETYQGFGIYYDDPKAVETSALKSDVGCILEPKDSGRLEELKTKFEVANFPIDEYLTLEFPFKGKLSMFVGIMKVYPAFDAFAEENGYDSNAPVMEIWDVGNEKTIYRMKLMKRV